MLCSLGESSPSVIAIAHCILAFSTAFFFSVFPRQWRLDLQSVDKVPFQCVRVSFCPENVGNLSSSPQNEWEFSPRSIQSCFPLLQGPSCRKSPSAPFRSNWVKIRLHIIPDRIENNVFFDPIVDCNRTWPSWIEKVLRVISCNWAPGEAGNSSG